MKRAAALLIGLIILVGGAGACGSSHNASNAGGGGGVSQATPAQTGAAASCVGAGTRRLPKTRLVADLGLTYGAFHRYLYTPFRSGAFHKGAHGRFTALAKAGLASGAIVKLLSNARKNAAADPTLCKFVPNIGNTESSLSTLGNSVKSGNPNATDFESTNGQFNQLKSGTGFTAPANSSLPGLG